MDLIKTLTAQYMKPELPAMRVGDTVRVTVRVTEGNRERTQAFEAPSSPRSTAASTRRSPSAASPTVWAARRFSRCTLPRSCPSRPFAAAKSAEPSCTTCATAWAREPRSKSLSKWILQKRLRPLFCIFGAFLRCRRKRIHTILVAENGSERV